MAGFADTVEQTILWWLFKQTAWSITAPTTLWVSLHGTQPDDTGSNELSTGTGSYNRAQNNSDTSSGTNTQWNAIGAGTGTAQRISNKADITFPLATANWFSSNPILYWGLWTAITAGTYFVQGTIGVAGVVVLNGNTLKFPGGTPGSLYFEID